MMELLSPAGNREALNAAVACGADAIYLGYTAFGARSFAGNFDADGLREAIEYAHERGKKIYVTVNTLVKQKELQGAGEDGLCDVLELLCRVGADAAIFQDLGAVRIARANFPELALHASTQMTVNNAQGAKLLRDLGFARVVPARECSLSELKLMADTGVEIEAFAHGALCVAVSGQCLFSSMIGSRSGNRGKCAQPCRLPYSLEGGKSGYLLSTSDLMLIEHIPQMRDAGVYSFKLEGRMKRPEYVGVITRAYREAIDAAEAHVPYTPSKSTIEGLKQVFNRGGFTQGYVMGKSNAALMSWERPNHWGIRVGKIVSAGRQLSTVQLERDLHDGDGLQARGKNEIEFTYSGKDTAKGSLATVRVAENVNVGDAVYRLTDAIQMKEIRDLMAKEQASIPVFAHLRAMPGELPCLSLSDSDGHSVTVQGEQPVDPAAQRALDHDTAFARLSKMGGTPYQLAELTLESEGAFVTAGVLNALRRDSLAQLREERIRIVRDKKMPVCEKAELPAQRKMLIAQGENLNEAKALLEKGADCFFWYPQCYQKAYLEREIKAYGEAVKPVLILPSVTYTEQMNAIHGFVNEHKHLIAAVQLNNIGQFGLRWPVPVYGGQGLNIANQEAARFYEAMGAQMLTLSCELTSSELHDVYCGGGNFEIEAYGRTQMMLLSHCPRRTQKGHEKQDAACDACAASGGCAGIYTDRKGYKFPLRRLKMEHGCVLRLYNSVVTDLGKEIQGKTGLPLSVRLAFTDESPERRQEIVASYRGILDGKMATHRNGDNLTTGHWRRSVD